MAVDRRRDGRTVWHIIGGDAALPGAGDQVVGVLDWETRYRLMRMHTARQVLCGAVFRDYGAFGHRRQHGAGAGPHGF